MKLSESLQLCKLIHTAETKWLTGANKGGISTALFLLPSSPSRPRHEEDTLGDVQVAQRSHEGWSCLSGRTRARRDRVYPRACACDE